MKKTKFTMTQIVKAIKEHEGGRKAEYICCGFRGIHFIFLQVETTLWDLEVQELKRLKEL